MSLLIGTSGWSYKEWVGPFYEKKTGMFSHYSQFFHTTEINSTFYRYPSEGMIMGLLRNAPPGFVFSAKLPKVITHDKWLSLEEGVEDDAHRFLSLMKPLAEHLGPILIQLRPMFNYDEHLGNLENFLEVIPKNYEWAVEFRDNSWLRNETFDLLRKNNVAYTVVDEPLLPPEVHITADFAYIRWHGHGAQLWYDYEYTEEQLASWVPKVKELTGDVRRTYGYFNNHYNANAVKNAVELLELLEETTPEQKIVHEKIVEYKAQAGGPRGVQPLEAFSTSSEDLSVADHLLHFTDPRRISRGEKMDSEEVIVSLSTDEHLMGEVKDYYVDIDLEQKVIKHNCADWRKGRGSKRFCKHLVRFFMELPPGQATHVLSRIWDEIDGWSFED
jgi:uncharacterized protein YecE (DUF72 family)